MIGTGISAFFTAISDCAKAFTAETENKLTLNTVREDRRQEKAIVAANKAFDIILQNIDYLPDKVQKSFLKYKKTFDKHIT